MLLVSLSSISTNRYFKGHFKPVNSTKQLKVQLKKNHHDWLLKTEKLCICQVILTISRKVTPSSVQKTLIQTYVWQGQTLKKKFQLKTAWTRGCRSVILQTPPTSLPSLLPTQLSVGVTTLQPSSQLHHVSINTGYILHRRENHLFSHAWSRKLEFVKVFRNTTPLLQVRK